MEFKFPKVSFRNGTKEHMAAILTGGAISIVLICFGHADKGATLGTLVMGYALGTGKGFIENTKRV